MNLELNSEETKMKASIKNEDVFVPVMLELETQKEIDILYAIGMTGGSVPDVVSAARNISRDSVSEICKRIYILLEKYKK